VPPEVGAFVEAGVLALVVAVDLAVCGLVVVLVVLTIVVFAGAATLAFVVG
jgi:hypothetical protein